VLIVAAPCAAVLSPTQRFAGAADQAQTAGVHAATQLGTRAGPTVASAVVVVLYTHMEGEAVSFVAELPYNILFMLL